LIALCACTALAVTLDRLQADARVTASATVPPTAGLSVVPPSASTKSAKLTLRSPLAAAAASDLYAIDAGGAAVSTFSSDEDYSTKDTWEYSVTKTVSTTGVSNAAPEGVYQTQRNGSFTYTLPGLTAGTEYTLRLHFAELFWTAAGDRVFSVTINGSTVLSNLDVFAAAGGEYKALVETVSGKANSAGQLVIAFTPTVNNAIVNGIEVVGSGAMPTPTPTPTIPPTSAQDNTTYHNNNLRNGWYSHETTLTAATVASSSFHQIGTMTTAGKSYSQPLYLTAQTLANGTTHNVLIITDSTDVVYAFDADSLGLLWERDFKGTGVRQQLASDIGCDDTWPNIGINGTPVVDRSRNRMYVVVPTYENGVAHLRLHALSLASGVDAVSPVEVAASVTLASGGTASVQPAYNFDRAGLLETNSTIYVPLSTHCDYDSNASHGWMLAYNPDTLAQTGYSVDTTNSNEGSSSGVHFLGSVWQGGFGIAADANSNIFFATGNGPNDGDVNDSAMSVIQLPPNLNFANRSFFTPSDWLSQSQNDGDLGSGGVMLLPDQTSGPYVHLAVAGGKSGVKYILNRDNLGGLHSTDQVLWENYTDIGIWGGPAYFVDSSGRQKILYGGTPSLAAYTLNTASGYSLTQTSTTSVGPLEHRNAGVTPIVSSNGTQAGSAVVWAIEGLAGNNTTLPVTLYAFNGDNLSNTLFKATAGRWTTNGDTGGVMITPLVANGRVYLATDGEVSVYGIH
jgi:hypothetical protein